MANLTLAEAIAHSAVVMEGRNSRNRIQALLDQADPEVLADLWRTVFPYPVDELPPHQGIVEDLADFAQVLQPRLGFMGAEHLCGLIKKYAAQRGRQENFVRSMICGVNAHGGHRTHLARTRPPQRRDDTRSRGYYAAAALGAGGV